MQKKILFPEQCVTHASRHLGNFDLAPGQRFRRRPVTCLDLPLRQKDRSDRDDPGKSKDCKEENTVGDPKISKRKPREQSRVG
ncbi:hypothetical protein N7E02_22795 [Aliirhizobium terrae]|uniref:hypothetical protein n=1 Tax=Terrirhizobium terrae TaxID=2926709 RepID=UPI00257605AC|nr:hypothetical protein [Rhizobium sp. CC-CFT758]WJH39586.1 hypothetical protein N7E02_22795 [Rhizobium sp. CC-CFT758]